MINSDIFPAQEIADALKAGNDERAIQEVIKFAMAVASRMKTAMSGLQDIDEDKFAIKLLAAGIVDMMKHMAEEKNMEGGKE